MTLAEFELEGSAIHVIRVSCAVQVNYRLLPPTLPLGVLEPASVTTAYVAEPSCYTVNHWQYSKAN